MNTVHDVKIGPLANVVYLAAWTLGVVVCTTYIDSQLEAQRIERMRAASFDCMIREHGEWMPGPQGFTCSHRFVLPDDPQFWHTPRGLADDKEPQR